MSARSSPLTQSCWKVAWAAAVEAEARATMADFILRVLHRDNEESTEDE